MSSSLSFFHSCRQGCFPRVEVLSENMKMSSVSFQNESYDLSEVEAIWIISIRNDMIYLPSNIGNFLPNLKKIEVHGTNITAIKRINFKFMRNVNEFSLDHNQIRSIDEDTLYDLPNLAIVGLRINRIKFLPSKLLHKSKRLTSFNVRDNEIESIPADFFIKNKHLKVILLSRNKLKTILFDFTKLKKLTELNLNENVCIDQLQIRKLKFNKV